MLKGALRSFHNLEVSRCDDVVGFKTGDHLFFPFIQSTTGTVKYCFASALERSLTFPLTVPFLALFTFLLTVSGWQVEGAPPHHQGGGNESGGPSPWRWQGQVQGAPVSVPMGQAGQGWSHAQTPQPHGLLHPPQPTQASRAVAIVTDLVQPVHLSWNPSGSGSSRDGFPGSSFALG